ncbi:glutamine amidotransferase [Sphingomonas psychrotolerans]|uniref:Glutamine amidotransferase n=1 Tax=Sphingomonas psychrotolerans TaxID=1327635 RepID=A0A2K8MCS2_9SPHN|nr:glutamine amidotransferase [Sphingomonas psychrotolerans]ATY31700.1 glutamine amidotransferase [Sphingomonas psychrotolerans]
MKTGLIIRHTPFEGIAGFREPIEAAGYVLDRVDVTDPGFSGLDFNAPDLLLMMGGPMGVYEREAHPWIAHELERLAERIERGLPTLGVCLGAQMIAAAMGAEVRPGAVKEIGFSPVTLNDPGAVSPLRHVAEVPMLHWHGDTFDLPERVELLASTPAYPHQAFRRGPELLALQFHAEMGEDPRFEAWIENGPAFIAEAGTSPERLRDEHNAHGAAAVAAGQAMIGEWLRGL